MKNHFKSCYEKRTPDQLREMFAKATICLDTNALLNLFHYKEVTTNEWLSVLEKLQPRLWVPHQVALEYHFNVERIIGNRLKNVSAALLKQFDVPAHQTANQTEFGNYNFMSDAERSALSSLKVELETSVKAQRESVRKQAQDLIRQWKVNYTTRCQSIKERIAKIFDQKVGNPYAPTQLSAVCTVIRDRYLQRIPPGYADKKKEENHGNPYGDAIAWFQMLEFAKDNCVKSLIFVTSDCNKEDWFYHDFEDKPVGPRAELVAEMRDFAGCEFHLYRSDIFLQAATDHLNASISEATMKETLQSVSVGPDDEIQDCSPVERMTIEEAQALFLKAIQDDKNKIVEASKAIEELCEAPQRAANKFLEANEKTARAIQQAGEIVVRQADEVAKVLKSIHKASSS